MRDAALDQPLRVLDNVGLDGIQVRADLGELRVASAKLLDEVAHRTTGRLAIELANPRPMRALQKVRRAWVDSW